MNFIFPAIILLGVQVYLFGWVLIPYLRFDQFQFWDSAGHYFAAWFQRNYLWPRFTGWNPFFFGGYPHDTFYGPAYHYLIALISFPFGLPLAFKFVTVLSIAGLPFSIYYFARKFKFNPSEAALAALFAMAPVAGLNLACGGTLFSQFVVGLGSNALGLPLFFLYVGKFKEELESRAPRKIILLTVLSVLIVLTHFVVVFAVLIAAVILLLNSFSRDNFVFSVKHALLTFLLSGFFLLPLVAYSWTVKDSGTILSMGFFLSLPLFLMILLGGAAGLLDRDARFDQTYFTIMATFAVMVFLDFGQIGLPMHAYRFVVFFMSLAMLLPIKLIFNRFSDLRIKLLFLAAFIVLAGWQGYIMLFNNPRYEINYNRLFTYNLQAIPYYPKIDLGRLEGRTLLLENPERLTPRATEHFLAIITGDIFLKGLFSESAEHAGYVLWLEQKAMGVILEAGRGKEDKLKSLNLGKLFNLFQVNYILSSFPIKNAQLVKAVPIRSDRPAYNLYKIGDSKIAEVLNYQPLNIDQNWRNAVNYWFESPDPRVLVRAKELPQTFASSGEMLSVVEEKISPARYKFFVKADKDVPILIKISYFPRWRAFVDNQPVKIYQAAPSFMLIYGKGDIRLEYQPTLIDHLGLLFFLAGAIWLSLEAYFGRQLKKTD